MPVIHTRINLIMALVIAVTLFVPIDTFAATSVFRSISASTQPNAPNKPPVQQYRVPAKPMQIRAVNSDKDKILVTNRTAKANPSLTPKMDQDQPIVVQISYDAATDAAVLESTNPIATTQAQAISDIYDSPGDIVNNDQMAQRLAEQLYAMRKQAPPTNSTYNAQQSRPIRVNLPQATTQVTYPVIKPVKSKGKRLYSLDTYRQIIQSASRTHGVDEALVRAIIHAESSFNYNARSHVGAGGLMQLMPATAKRFGVVDRFNPQQNINGGTQYLAWLLRRYNGNVTLATAAYNAGEGAVDKYGGVPPYRETRGYVVKVAGLFENYNQALTGSFSGIFNQSILSGRRRQSPSSYVTGVRMISSNIQ